MRFIGLLFMLIACSLKPTQYKEKGSFSYEGYEEVKTSQAVYRVSFTGVGHESPELIEKLLDRRCAEIAVREGYDWFYYYTKNRNDNVGIGRKSVPSFYGIIHLRKGPVGEDGLIANQILATSLPEGIEQ